MFRHKKTNQRLQKALFLETAEGDLTYVLYTLRDEDKEVNGKVYPSLYKLYLECEDLSEWDFANKYFEGYEHWEMISNSYWFKEFIERWRKHLELKLKAEALNNIKAEALGAGKNSFAANKYLLEKGWIEKDQSKRGRPSKAEIMKLAQQEAEDMDRVLADHERLMNIN